MSRKNKKLLRCKSCRTLTEQKDSDGTTICNICWTKRHIAATDTQTKHHTQLARLRDELNKLREAD